MSFDIDRFFRKQRAKASAEEPTILAVVVSDSAPESVIQVLKDQGMDLDPESAQAGDKAKLYPQVDCDLTDEESADRRISYKIHPDVVVISQVQKTFQPFQGSTSFKENLASQGFFPKAAMSMDIFGETMANIMFESENKGDAVQRMKDEGMAFVTTMTELVELLPEKVFKLEAALDEHVASVAKVEAKKASTETVVETKKEDEAPATEEAVAETDEAKTDEDETTESDSADDEEAGEVTQVAKENGASEIVDAVLAALNPKLDALGTRLDGFEQKQKEFGTAIAGSANVTDLGDEDGEGDDEGAVMAVPLIDTGMKRYGNPDRQIFRD